MRAWVIPITIPNGKGSSITIYRVDYENYQITGFHESLTTTGTFGFYENKAVADYIADEIIIGKLNPIPVQEFEQNDD